jgi:DNA-directed RNA polymerase II subunit RPB2
MKTLDNLVELQTTTEDIKNEPDVLGKYTEAPWQIIESYFTDQHLQRLVRHQLESYNDFVTHQIQKTIQMFNPVNIHSDHDYNPLVNKYSLEVYITFKNFHMYRPQIHENNGATKIMFPHEARLRNFTYASTMTIDIDIKYVVKTGEQLENTQILCKTLPKIHIGKLPIMLRSAVCVLTQYKHISTDLTGECKYDAGGYFIVNGSEKTVLGQERAAENGISCFDVEKTSSKWSWVAETKSVPDFKCISPKQISIMIATKNNGFGHSIQIQIPRIKQPVPIFILFRALGIISDKEICKIILLKLDTPQYKKLLYVLRGAIVESNKQITQEDAIQYIINLAMYTPMNMDKEAGILKKREFTLDVIHNDLFPHCKTKIQKIYYLGYMIKRLLLCSCGITKPDDRDAYINKRIDLTGTLLNNLFRNYFNKLVKDMQRQIIREINTGSWKSTDDFLRIINQTNIYKIVKSTTVENGIKRALATGDFGIKHSNSNKVGVGQVLNRLTYIASLSHLRRISTPMDKSGKLIPPRKLPNTSWGFICPAETPEGQSVGVVKNLANMTHVTIPSNSASIYEYVKPYVSSLDSLVPIEFNEPETSTNSVGNTILGNSILYNTVKVFINGAWIGITYKPLELYKSLKEKKYKGIMNIYTSIIFNYKDKEIRICNEAGRVTRPLLRVRDNKLLITNDILEKLRQHELTWDDLLTDCRIPESVIEYIDPCEQNVSMIAMTPHDLKRAYTYNTHSYTHCEIHPSTILGILASCIPFPQHNQAPRITYQCAMGKQAMGMYVTNFDTRMDKTSYILSYPMRPIVDTRLMNLIKLNKIPSGEQVVVAIMTYTGYNQEDSIIFNGGSLARGLFQATIFATEKDEDKKIHGDEEIRCRPNANRTKGMKFGNYQKLTNDGIIPENTLLENRDIIIGKVSPIKEARNDHTKIIKYEDQSRCFKTHEECYLDKNLVNRNGEGYTFCKVRVRTLRVPIIGDKFSSRHGQKGTIGNIIPEEDMPFTADGIRPDLIINPHAIPSRMTIGQLKETLLGLLLMELGLFGDGSSFNELSIDIIRDELLKMGYEANGNSILYDGLTGEQIQSSIFIGPVFYQRLKHMVNDKLHSRSIGPMVNLTRQPAEGRSREGGLRFGEMERDCMVSHGTAKFTKERILEASDYFEVHVCKLCGLIAAYNNEKHIHHCHACNNRADFALVKIPYACKLLFQELITMNIVPRIITK